jgi:peptide/nickel transport system permease protein
MNSRSETDVTILPAPGLARQPAASSTARSPKRMVVRRFAKQPLGMLGLVIFTVLLVVAVVGPLVAPRDPYELGAAGRLKPPSAANLAGTDHLGRDVLSRVMYGVRPSIVVAVGAVVVSITLGTAFGGVSALVGGKFDLVLQRVMDSVSTLPSLFLGVLVLTILSPSYLSLILTVGLVTVPTVQRVVRASTLSEKERDYVLAGRVVGATQTRVLTLHILPNITSSILVIASAELGSAILIAASLSFLGFGTPPPEPSLGAMISGEGRQFMVQAPWLVIIPATIVSLAVLSANFIGDALRDTLDPRLTMR